MDKLLNMENKFKVGMKVRIKGHNLLGEIEAMFFVKVEPCASVKLKDGLWTEGRNTYVSSLVCHLDNLEEISAIHWKNLS
jgi:hypothetical protein